MKSKILLFVFFVFNLATFAQNGISFQGIARDVQGNAIANQSIEVIFSIGNSFTETQNLQTDNFGVFSAVIGSVETTAFNSLGFTHVSENLKVEVDGTVIYNDQFNSVPYAKFAKTAENGVPTGSIMPFAGSVPSGSNVEEPIPGWIVCNGATLTNDAKFDNLKQVLGNSWGNNRVPDLRGVFLRGVNNGRIGDFSDPDAANRVAVNSGATGDNVGSFQGDNNKDHSHTGTTSSDGRHNHNWTYDASSSESGDGQNSILGDDQFTYSPLSDWNIATDYEPDHDHKR